MYKFSALSLKINNESLILSILYRMHIIEIVIVDYSFRDGVPYDRMFSKDGHGPRIPNVQRRAVYLSVASVVEKIVSRNI